MTSINILTQLCRFVYYLDRPSAYYVEVFAVARLEDISIGSVVNGVLPNEPITVVSTKWYGSTCLDVFYKTNKGLTGDQVLYRDDEPSLTILEKSLPWSFDIPGDKMRLVSEAY